MWHETVCLAVGWDIAEATEWSWGMQLICMQKKCVFAYSIIHAVAVRGIFEGKNSCNMKERRTRVWRVKSCRFTMEKIGEETIPLVRVKVQTRLGERKTGERDEIGRGCPPYLPRNKEGRRNFWLNLGTLNQKPWETKANHSIQISYSYSCLSLSSYFCMDKM